MLGWGVIRAEALPPITNRQSWVWELELVDPYETGDDAPIDLTGSTIVLALRRIGPLPSGWLWGYPSYPDYEQGYFGYAPQIEATTANGGAVIVDIGVVQFIITEDQIRGICPGQYEVSCSIARDSEQVLLFKLDMPIIDGVVTQ